jgi:hypothetical protein
MGDRSPQDSELFEGGVSSYDDEILLDHQSKKVSMENNLELNQNELDYYEEIVNDLAEKLEFVTKERDDLVTELTTSEEVSFSCPLFVSSFLRLTRFFLVFLLRSEFTSYERTSG